MTQQPWYHDTRMLAAGNARAIPGGDPAAMPVSPAAPDGSHPAVAPRDLAGDLNASAARLGVDVTDLIRLRRELGIAGRHRRDGFATRLAARIRRAVR